LKSDPEPMTLSQITNIKILSLNTSKLKQFLSLKDEQLNKSSQWNNLKEKTSKKKKTSMKKSLRIKIFTMRISKNANNKKNLHGKASPWIKLHKHIKNNLQNQSFNS
jgi:CRISPR/Cas system-associated endonuclease Cas3-HD